jgi:hypothetical protein
VPRHSFNNFGLARHPAIRRCSARCDNRSTGAFYLEDFLGFSDILDSVNLDILRWFLAQADLSVRTSTVRRRRLFARLLGLLTAFVAIQPCWLAAQQSNEPFWIAGRYDGNRVIIYFDAVKFNKSVPRNARRVVRPVSALFPPIELPPNYIAGFFKVPGVFRFNLGDQFDVLTGGDAIRVKLTTLVGSEGDEEVGNDSYIGALATVVGECPLLAGTDFLCCADPPGAGLRH